MGSQIFIWVNTIHIGKKNFFYKPTIVWLNNSNLNTRVKSITTTIIIEFKWIRWQFRIINDK